MAELIMSRVRAQPSKNTFTIKPIAELLSRYISSPEGWVDPFAGWSSPAMWTNDHNPDAPTKFHMDAEEFCKEMSNQLGFVWGVLFDPPYSYRQVTENYKFLGMKASQLDTSSNFYNRVMNAICDKVMPGGLAISFGWNTNGFGKSRGFEPIEILLVPHGQHHNDTLVTVERKFADPLKHPDGSVQLLDL